MKNSTKQSRFTLNLYSDNPQEQVLINILESMNKSRRAEIIRTWIKMGAFLEPTNINPPVQHPTYSQSLHVQAGGDDGYSSSGSVSANRDAREHVSVDDAEDKTYENITKNDLDYSDEDEFEDPLAKLSKRFS